MILKALYDYYQRCDDLPALGMEEKEIGFILVIDNKGKFLHFEDCRIDKNSAMVFLVKKHVGRSSAPVANYLYDNSAYVFGYSDKDQNKAQLYFDTFKKNVLQIQASFPDSKDLKALVLFYSHPREEIIEELKKDPLWDEVSKNLAKKYSTFSFRIQGDTRIVAQKKEILGLQQNSTERPTQSICLITGKNGNPVETTTATMIPGSQATAKLVSFQVNSGYDSYGHQKGYNAPISEDAEFAYTTALNKMLGKGSHNKFVLGTRTFLFWASSNSEAGNEAEAGLWDLLGFKDEPASDDSNRRIEQVRKVFTSIYSGSLKTTLDDRFYILGLAPNAARIAVVYWSESSLKDFAGKILSHFNDMEIVDRRKEKKPYSGMKEMLSAVTLGGKQSEATPNLPDAVVKSIFEGVPYPYTLFSSCIRRIRAESADKDRNPVRIARAAILKAFLNRTNDNNNKKLDIMLDKENTNPGYLCGRLFAVLDKIQDEANRQSTIRERYLNSASATPVSVFSTILKLSGHHAEKLNPGRRITFEKLKQEIIDKLPVDGFPSHLSLQDQGRFFVGYYHQREDLFKGKENEITTEE